MERKPNTVHLDQNGRRDPRLTRPLLPTDLRRRTLADKLNALATEYSPGRYLDELRSSTPPARHTPHVIAFGRPDGVAAVTEFSPSIVRSGGTVQVCGGGKRLTFHERAELDLRTLLSGHPVYLNGASEDITTLADLLITEGLCEPLTGISSSGYTGLVTPVTYSKQPPTSA